MGSNIGQVVLPFGLRFLLNTYGLSGTYLIFSGITLNIVACAALIRPTSFYDRKPNKCIRNSQTVSFGKKLLEMLKSLKSQQIPDENAALLDKREKFVCSKDFTMDNDSTNTKYDDEKSQSSNKGQMRKLVAVLRCKRAMLLTFADCIELASGVYILAFLPSLAIEYGMNEQNAGSLLAVSAIGQVFSRPVYGFISVVSPINNYYLLSIFELSSGILTMSFALWGHPTNLVWFTLFTGVFLSKFCQALPSFLVEELDSELLPSAIGVQLLMEGIAIAISGPALGKFLLAKIICYVCVYWLADG